jgi:uncharacterized phiE125 gp8 family phage protein
MSVFIQPPFWAADSRRPRTPHGVAVPVPSGAIALVSSSAAAADPTVLSTGTVPHGLASGDTVAVAGHTGSTPTLDGSHVATVLTTTTFTVPVNVTVGGTGGTVTRTTPVEPLTLAQAKLRAGLDWADGDVRDALMTGFIASARAKVEKDTGVALLTQMYDVLFDELPGDVFDLPWRPVQAVVSVKTVDTSGAVQTLDAVNYLLDPSSAVPVPARLSLSQTGTWPTDLRSFQPWAIRVVVGHASLALLQAAAPELVDAVGLLVAHAATAGRDRMTEADLRDEYEEKIASYQLVTLA